MRENTRNVCIFLSSTLLSTECFWLRSCSKGRRLLLYVSQEAKSASDGDVGTGRCRGQMKMKEAEDWSFKLR